VITKSLGIFGLLFAVNATASIDYATWSADSPSFSCKGEHLSAVEARVCDQKGLWNADRAMATLYKEASERLDTEHRKLLVLGQRHWLKARDRCNDLDCLGSAYATRSNEIWEMILADAQEAPMPVFGKTPQDRIAYLRFISDHYEGDIDSRNRFYFPGLKDSNPNVRSFAAFSIRGSSYTGLLIDLLVVEPDADVRTTLAISISCELTCNGTEPCAEASTVEQHLTNLLVAYKRSSAEPGQGEENLNLTQLFDAYDGTHDWNKCLSPKGQNQIREIASQK
jgi:uncharacterized protein YecT (DUF1311 family)